MTASGEQHDMMSLIVGIAWWRRVLLSLGDGRRYNVLGGEPLLRASTDEREAPEMQKKFSEDLRLG